VFLKRFRFKVAWQSFAVNTNKPCTLLSGEKAIDLTKLNAGDEAQRLGDSRDPRDILIRADVARYGRVLRVYSIVIPSQVDHP
jgi:hypothetical protein